LRRIKTEVDLYYNGDNETKLTDLTSVRQGRDESIQEYFKKFKDIKNRCFNLSLSEKDLVDLALAGLRSSYREKLDGLSFYSINQLQAKALSQETRFQKEKDTYKSHRSNTHVVEYDSDSSDDEDKEAYAAEFVWPALAKPSTCTSLKPTQKNRQEEMKFTFDVSKCDRIFDELLRLGHLKITHVIPPLEELKRRAYCKFHNSSSHATNDCNVFRRQVQSAINEGRLAFPEMKIDKASFPVHTIDLNNAKVLIRPDQAEGAKGKNVIIGDDRPLTVDNKIFAREMI